LNDLIQIAVGAGAMYALFWLGFLPAPVSKGAAKPAVTPSPAKPLSEPQFSEEDLAVMRAAVDILRKRQKDAEDRRLVEKLSEVA
jgi:hypothetical protein